MKEFSPLDVSVISWSRIGGCVSWTVPCGTRAGDVGRRERLRGILPAGEELPLLLQRPVRRCRRGVAGNADVAGASQQD